MFDVQKSATPEAAHLAEQERLLGDLADELASRETEFVEMGGEFARFRVAYVRRFAPLYAELDRLEAEIARMVAAMEGSPAARVRASEAEDLAQESTRAEAQAAEQPDPSEQGRVAAPLELRDLYREAAKKIHPDLAADDDERERRTNLMAALNAAYSQRDVNSIRRILQDEAVRPEAILGTDTASRLVRVIRKIAQIRERLAEIARLVGELEADPLFVFFAQARESAALAGDPLAEDEALLRTRVASAHAQLAALLMMDP